MSDKFFLDLSVHLEHREGGPAYSVERKVFISKAPKWWQVIRWWRLVSLIWSYTRYAEAAMEARR